ncbi:response regulator [Vagococcus sp. BWB3-3]|uniref:Response regulator n=1 Tax=Vagococcus allomyrinae TaxID=2794353 RepID=A0A940P4U0_9ENTE|nr:response regulator [Vagococcus allomyrinae]MBP1039751.1 response regulator [Vagococcus allomyrinae]
MTLIIIDDEPIIRRGLARMVTHVENHFADVLQAETAHEALALIDKQDRITAVFADINLPDMNGLDLVAAIKKRCPETLIVMISGYDDFSYARQAIHLGVFDYLLKPVAQSDMKDLVDRLTYELVNASGKTKKKYSTNELCNRAADYLTHHHAKKYLSLSMVATALFVDPSYLSKQMKQHLGKSFNDYLVTLRIAKAKELLQQEFHYSVQEIGEKIGYPSQHYFSRVFKQHTGLSPSQYRQQERD